jgi:xanthine dehydrogenase molybdopterin-binding subunit B
MTMQSTMRATGAPLNRFDGVQKVTGAAKYAYEYPVDHVTYVFPVQSTIAKGRVVSIDASAARALPGVIAVLSHENAPQLAPVNDAKLAVFQSEAIAYRGQFVAVVAETLETARQAAAISSHPNTYRKSRSDSIQRIAPTATSRQRWRPLRSHSTTPTQRLLSTITPWSRTRPWRSGVTTATARA